jgi:hypothetical protein
MHQQLWGYKVELKSVSRGTGGKKVEYHCSTGPHISINFCCQKFYKGVSVHTKQAMCVILWATDTFSRRGT